MARTITVIGAFLYAGMLALTYPPLSYPIGVPLHFVPESAADVMMVLILCSLAAFPALHIPLRIERPSLIIGWILYLIVLIPAVVLPLYALECSFGWWLAQAVFLVACFSALMWALPRLVLVRVPAPRDKGPFWWTVGVCLLLYMLSVHFGHGFNLSIPEQEDVYAVRENYVTGVTRMGVVIHYLSFWQGYVINSILLAGGLLRKNPVLLGLAVVGQLAVLTNTGYRSFMLALVLIPFVLVVLGREGKACAGLRMVWITFLSYGGLLLATLGLDSHELYGVTNLTFFRLINTPGMLTGFYFDFFRENPHLQLSESVLRPIVSSPYLLPFHQLVGQVYMGSSKVSANANLWAQAFADFGYFGVILFTILLGAVMWALDSIAQNRDRRMVTLLLAMPSISLANSGLFTCLLTHGIGLLMLLILLLPEKHLKPAPVAFHEPANADAPPVGGSLGFGRGIAGP